MSAPPPVTQAPLAPAAAALRAQIAAGLSAAAGRHAFSNRRRRFDVGYSERLRRRAMYRFAMGSFVAVVAFPVLAALLYWGALAEDQYVAEARFLLRVNRAAAADRIGALTGLPAIEARRDTQVVAEFLESAALVAALEARAGLRDRYGGPAASFLRPETWLAGDWVARLAPDATAEDLLDHWEDMAAAEIELPAGIVHFEVAAFTAEDARALAAAGLAEAEALIARLNAAAWNEAVTTAETLFAGAADRLADVQARLALARNEAGILSAETEAGMLSGLAGETRAELIRLEQDYAAAAPHLDPGSARMQALERRIEALRTELSTLGTERVADEGDGGLAAVMARFSGLEVEQEMAERAFLSAAKKLEQVRQVAEARQMHLDIFVEPARPEAPTRPRRALAIGLTLGAALALWGAACGAFSLVRNHMA